MSFNSGEHNIILVSNACVDKYPNNSRAVYINDLPSQYTIEKKKWTVSVESLFFDNSFSAIPSNVLFYQPNFIVMHKDLNAAISISLNPDDKITSVLDLTRLVFEKLHHHISHHHPTFEIQLEDYPFFQHSHVGPQTIKTLIPSEWHVFFQHETLKWLNMKESTLKPAYLFGKNYQVVNGNVKMGLKRTLKHFIPPKINLKLSQLQPYPSNNSYSQLLGSIILNKKTILEPSGFHYSFEGKEQFELDKESTSFKVELIDQSGKPIPFPKGQPTILTLHLKHKMTESFMMTVSSEENQEIFPQNTNYDFKVALPSPINLSGIWKVALTSCQLPSELNLQTYIEHELYEMFTFAEGLQTLLSFRNDGNDDIFDVGTLIQKISDLILPIKAPSEPSFHGKKITLLYNVNSKVVSIERPSSVTLLFNRPLANLLGILDPVAISENFTSFLSSKTKMELGKPLLHKLIPQSILIYAANSCRRQICSYYKNSAS